MKKAPEYTVHSENGTFWVNGKHNCLGRFTKNAWEIYNNMKQPTEVIGTTSTLEVSKKPTDEKSWHNFVRQMKAHHAIDLTEEEYPGKEATK